MSLRLRSLLFSSLICCFALRLVNFVEAQTDTPEPTDTAAASSTPDFSTFTPGAATETPDSARFVCPGEVVYARDVSVSYLVQCGHCVTTITDTPAPVSYGLPQIGLPISPVFSPTVSPTGSITPSATLTVNPYLTEYPTVTPFFHVPTATITDTPVDTPTPAPTSTPGSVLAFLLEDGSNFAGEVVVMSWDDYFNSNDGFSYEYDSGDRSFNRGTQANVGLAVVFPGLTHVNYIEYEVFNDAHTGDYEYETAVRVHHEPGVTILWSTGNGTVHIHPLDDDELLADFDGFAHHQEINDEVYAIIIDTGHYGTVALSTVPQTKIQLSLLSYVGFGVGIPTVTPTPTPTLTPVGQVDCRNVNSGNDPSQFIESDGLENGLQQVSRTCFTVIDPSFELNLTSLNAAWYLKPEPLEVCLVLFRVPVLVLLGISLPLDMAVAIALIAWFVRIIRSY